MKKGIILIASLICALSMNMISLGATDAKLNNMKENRILISYERVGNYKGTDSGSSK